MNLTEAREKQFSTVRIIGFAMLIAAPMIYSLLAFLILKPEPNLNPGLNFMFYILIIVSVSQPLVIPLISKSQINNFKRSSATKMNPAGLFTTLSIIKFAFVESIYLYGLVDYMLSGDKFHYLIFVVIGLCWSAPVWPRREKFELFIEKVEPYGQK